MLGVTHKCTIQFMGGLAFEGEEQFEYQVTGGPGDFSIALHQSQSDSLQRHLAEFSKLHIAEIQKSMRP